MRSYYLLYFFYLQHNFCFLGLLCGSLIIQAVDYSDRFVLLIVGSVVQVHGACLSPTPLCGRLLLPLVSRLGVAAASERN